MAMGKKVIVSDVAALKEMVIDGENGTYFEAENPEALEKAIIEISQNEEIGKHAREWVEQNRDWEVLLQDIVDIYEKESCLTISSLYYLTDTFPLFAGKPASFQVSARMKHCRFVHRPSD